LETIMILYTAGSGLYEAKRALLEKFDDTQLKLPRFFSTSEQIASYLSAAAGVKFVLSVVAPLANTSADNLLATTASDAYGPRFGDILCGIVTYDGAKNQVLTVGTYTDDNFHRIWGG
jgi:hypothetical protein